MKILKAFTILLLTAFSLYSQIGDLEVGISLDTYYKDNIFSLSDDEMNEFENSADPEQYPYETADDLILEKGLDIDYKIGLLGMGKTGISLGLADYTFIKNTDKNYRNFTVGISQSFNDFYISMSYKFMPDYLVRHYKDDDIFNEYKPFEYEKEYYMFDINYSFPTSTKVYAGYTSTQSYYNGYFPEFNSKGSNTKLGIRQKLPFGLYVSAYYYFNVLEADGTDGEPNIDSDQSYEEDKYRMIFSYTTPKFLGDRYRLRANLSYASRYFQTDNDINDDYYHRGRRDYTFTAEASISRKLYKYLRSEIYYSYTNRDSDDGYGNELSPKVYDASTVGMKLTATFNIF